VAGDAETATEAWLVLHGYGMLARGILHWFRKAERPGRALVAPGGLSRFYTEMSDGKRTVGASWVTREDLTHEIEDQFAYVERVVSEMIPVGAVLQVHGFSQGVSVGTRWAARTTRRISRLVCWAGSIPDDVAPADLTRALAGEAVDLVVGDRDGRVPPERVTADGERLEAGGTAVRLHRFAGGHRIDDGVLAGF
jgi:predicted esterase